MEDLFSMVVEPATTRIGWMSPNGERLMRDRSGASPIGRTLQECVDFSEEAGLVTLVCNVASDGEPRDLHLASVSVEGRPWIAHVEARRLPSGDVLVVERFSTRGRQPE